MDRHDRDRHRRVHVGFVQGARFSRNLSDLDEFLALPIVETLRVDRETAAILGELISDLRRRGRPIPTNDIWIATTCERAGATLLTWDAHFRAISRIGSIVFESAI